MTLAYDDEASVALRCGRLVVVGAHPGIAAYGAVRVTLTSGSGGRACLSIYDLRRYGWWSLVRLGRRPAALRVVAVRAFRSTTGSAAGGGRSCVWVYDRQRCGGGGSLTRAGRYRRSRAASHSLP